MDVAFSLSYLLNYKCCGILLGGFGGLFCFVWFSFQKTESVVPNS